MKRLLGGLLALGVFAFVASTSIATAEERTASAPASAHEIYVVQPGDTLSAIALRFGTSVTAIVEANHVTNPHLVAAGRWLIIPPAAAQAPAPASPASDTAASDSAVLRPVHAMVIGRSMLGQPIQVLCTGSGDMVVLLVGGMHTGHEANTVTLVSRLAATARSGAMQVPDGVWLCFLPSLNPDGLTLGLHTNARRVDLNRNWPAADWQPIAFHPASGRVSGGTAPLSEPETRALYDFALEARPALVMVWHCCGDLVEVNALPVSHALGRRYAAVAGTGFITRWTAYEITGEFIRTMEARGIPAIDVELVTPGDIDVDRHLPAVEAVLRDLAAR